MTRRRSIAVAREGWFYIVVLGFIIAGAIIRDINLLFILAGMMLGPLVLSAWLVQVTLRRLEVQRRVPGTVSVGDLLVVDLQVTNSRRRGSSWALVAEDRLERVAANGVRPTATAAARVLFPYVRPGTHLEGSYRARLHERGRYQLGPLKVSTRVPLGLLRATVTFATTDSLVVCPRIGRLLVGWAEKLKLQHQGGHRSQRRQGKREGDYFGLRDWRSGDSRRWIHWRTSAKRDQLAVKQFEQMRSQDVAIVLELWQTASRTDNPVRPAAPVRPNSRVRPAAPPRPTADQRQQIELAISFVATLVADHCRRGHSHMLVASSGQRLMRASGVSSAVFLQEIVEQLAVVQPDARDRLPELLHEILPHVPTNARIVLVSTRAIDLGDTERFAMIWDDPRKRRLLAGAITVDVTSTEFAQWFQEEPTAVS